MNTKTLSIIKVNLKRFLDLKTTTLLYIYICNSIFSKYSYSHDHAYNFKMNHEKSLLVYTKNFKFGNDT
jgi:hypothetical protein